MKILLVIFLILLVPSIGLAYFGDSWNQADIEVASKSVDGNSTSGLSFDPDNDNTNEITMEPDGDLYFSGDLSVSVNATASGAGTGPATYVSIYISGQEYRFQAQRV